MNILKWNVRSLILIILLLIVSIVLIATSFASNNVQATNDPDDFCDVSVDNTSQVEVTRSGDFCILSFKRIGTTLWNKPAWVTTVEYLIVGGGGAGGSRAGGGGGAGGVLTNSTHTLSGAQISVTVGAGGIGVNDDPGGDGGSTTFDGQTAIGGGGGGAAEGNDNFERNGRDGGSGGGSSGGASGDNSTPGSGTSGQGFNGGKGRNGNAIAASAGWPGGGGGGFSSVGETPSTNTGGSGGTGFVSSISGASMCYSAGGGGGTQNVYFAGAAGSCSGVSSSAGAGTSGNVNGNAAVANSGSGGGGSGWSGGVNNDNPGGNGGSGIVIVKFSIPPRPSVNASEVIALVDPRAESIELPVVDITSWVNNRACITISNSNGALALDGSDSNKYKVEITSGSGASSEFQGANNFKFNGTPAQISEVFEPSNANKSRIKITKPSSGNFSENITLTIRSDNSPNSSCADSAPGGDPLLTATIKPYGIDISQKNDISLN